MRLCLILSILHCFTVRTGSVLFDLEIIGKPLNVWNSVDTLHKCGIIDVPDIPARIFFEKEKDLVHMVEGSTAFYPMNGKSVFNLTRSCKAKFNKTTDPHPEMFADNEFLDSTFAFDNGTVVSLLHTEFVADKNYCNETGYTYPRCWTVSIGLAISEDWGENWKHIAPPPNHLVAAVPYVYNQSQLASGWGDPSNIIFNPNDGFYYVAMWNRHNVGLQQAGTCIARTNNLMDPFSWRGWNGNDFTTTFVSPYDLDPHQAKDPHICSVVETFPPLCAALGIVWSTYLETFVATLGCFEEKSRYFYIATSDDLIHWSSIQPFYSEKDFPEDVKKKVTSIAYPSFFDPSAPERGDVNYNTVGEEPFLFWVSLGHSTYTDGRNLWATPFKFTKSDNNKVTAS